MFFFHQACLVLFSLQRSFTLWVIAGKAVLACRSHGDFSSWEPSSIRKFGMGVEAIDAFARAPIKMLLIAGLDAVSYPEHDRDRVPSAKCPCDAVRIEVRRAVAGEGKHVFRNRR